MGWVPSATQIKNASPQPPTPTSAASFWKANPQLAYRALQYVQSHSSDRALASQLMHDPKQFQQLAGHPEAPRARGPQGPHQLTPQGADFQTAQKLVHAQIGALTQQGVDPQQARGQLLDELLAAHAHQQKTISASESITDPIEQLYKQGGDPTAEAIIKLGGTIKDPFQVLKKGTKTKDAQTALFDATFARSPMGQKALAENNPQAAAQLARVQLGTQIVQNFQRVTVPGGVADQYDQSSRTRTSARPRPPRRSARRDQHSPTP